MASKMQENEEIEIEAIFSSLLINKEGDETIPCGLFYTILKEHMQSNLSGRIDVVAQKRLRYTNLMDKLLMAVARDKHELVILIAEHMLDITCEDEYGADEFTNEDQFVLLQLMLYNAKLQLGIDLYECIEFYRKLYKQKYKYPVLYLKLTMCYLHLGNIEEAKKIAKEGAAILTNKIPNEKMFKTDLYDLLVVLTDIAENDPYYILIFLYTNSFLLSNTKAVERKISETVLDMKPALEDIRSRFTCCGGRNSANLKYAVEWMTKLPHMIQYLSNVLLKMKGDLSLKELIKYKLDPTMEQYSEARYLQAYLKKLNEFHVAKFENAHHAPYCSTLKKVYVMPWKQRKKSNQHSKKNLNKGCQTMQTKSAKEKQSQTDMRYENEEVKQVKREISTLNTALKEKNAYNKQLQEKCLFLETQCKHMNAQLCAMSNEKIQMQRKLEQTYNELVMTREANRNLSMLNGNLVQQSNHIHFNMKKQQEATDNLVTTIRDETTYALIGFEKDIKKFQIGCERTLSEMKSTYSSNAANQTVMQESISFANQILSKMENYLKVIKNEQQAIANNMRTVDDVVAYCRKRQLRVAFHHIYKFAAMLYYFYLDSINCRLGLSNSVSPTPRPSPPPGFYMPSSSAQATATTTRTQTSVSYAAAVSAAAATTVYDTSEMYQCLVKTDDKKDEGKMSMDMINAITDFLQNKDEEQCCICIEPLHNGMRLKTLPCGHLFHHDCIQGWKFHKEMCPICRKCFI